MIYSFIPIFFVPFRRHLFTSDRKFSIFIFGVSRGTQRKRLPSRAVRLTRLFALARSKQEIYFFRHKQAKKNRAKNKRTTLLPSLFLSFSLIHSRV